MESQKGTGDRGGARAAVGLEHVAIDVHGPLPERGKVNDRSERASDQALDLLRAPGLLAARRLALAAGVGGARQHAVFSGYPAAAAVLEERRYALFDARGAQHAGIAELDQHRAFGMLGVAPLDAHRPQLVCAAAAYSPGVHFIATTEMLSQSAPADLSASDTSSETACGSGRVRSASIIWRCASGPQKPSEHRSRISSGASGSAATGSRCGGW